MPFNLIKGEFTVYIRNSSVGHIDKVELISCEIREEYFDAGLFVFVSGVIEQYKRFHQFMPQFNDKYVLVLKGWGYPDPTPLIKDLTLPSGERFTFPRKSPLWIEEFNSMINPVIKANPDIVLGDYRDNKIGKSE